MSFRKNKYLLNLIMTLLVCLIIHIFLIYLLSEYSNLLQTFFSVIYSIITALIIFEYKFTKEKQDLLYSNRKNWLYTIKNVLENDFNDKSEYVFFANEDLEEFKQLITSDDLIPNNLKKEFEEIKKDKYNKVIFTSYKKISEQTTPSLRIKNKNGILEKINYMIKKLKYINN